MNLIVELKHCSNPDIVGGYWQDGNPDAAAVCLNVPDLDTASRKVREYIESNGLGGGNWSGGRVFMKVGKAIRHIANISYNGRIWDTKGKPLCAS